MSDISEQVRARYAAAAEAVRAGAAEGTATAGCCGYESGRTTAARGTDTAGCCGAESASSSCGEEAVFGPELYDEADQKAVPEAALLASLGCGNPMAVADLHEGETVLDLGSGGGIDVLLSAKRVGPTGKAYGVDMTDEMLALALDNKSKANLDNVEFLKGRIEAVPLPSNLVDVVISNCVINLSADKPAVFTEMARVLKRGGRIGITDVVADDELTLQDRAARGSYVGCIAGALSFSEYRNGLEAVGLSDVEITPTHSVADGMYSVMVRARKPA